MTMQVRKTAQDKWYSANRDILHWYQPAIKAALTATAEQFDPLSEQYEELLNLTGLLAEAANAAFTSDKELLPELMKAHYSKLTSNKAFPQFDHWQ